jgi:hypothetical protein
MSPDPEYAKFSNRVSWLREASLSEAVITNNVDQLATTFLTRKRRENVNYPDAHWRTARDRFLEIN